MESALVRQHVLANSLTIIMPNKKINKNGWLNIFVQILELGVPLSLTPLQPARLPHHAISM
jgi:hypothetical protein